MPHARCLLQSHLFAGSCRSSEPFSNTIIVFSHDDVPEVAISALVFLVVIHKLEYLLNSKIIGTGFAIRLAHVNRSDPWANGSWDPGLISRR